jgi:hypothetical protein
MAAGTVVTGAGGLKAWPMPTISRPAADFCKLCEFNFHVNLVNYRGGGPKVGGTSPISPPGTRFSPNRNRKHRDAARGPTRNAVTLMAA